MNVQSSIFVVLVLCGIAVANEETRLIKHLFRVYGDAERATRGVKHARDTLNVSFGLAIINILDMDTTNGIVTLSAWKRYAWTDRRLAWDQSSGFPPLVRVPTSFIWLPDITQYNAAPVVKEETTDCLAVLYYGGTVLWIPPATVRAACHRLPNPTELAWRCSLKFGSWTYDGHQVDFQFYDNLQDIDLDDFKVLANGWKVTNHSAERNVKYYPCCSEPYPDLTFSFDLSK